MFNHPELNYSGVLMRAGSCKAVITLACYLSLGGQGNALDVDFDGLVSTVCSVSLNTHGTLALSDDGTELGSEESGGAAGAVLILSIGSNVIDVAAPIRVGADPAGYNSAGEVLEVKYSGAGGLSAISQGYTSGDSDFDVSNIALSVLTLHNRIVNANGFAAGDYTTRTVVTCS